MNKKERTSYFLQKLPWILMVTALAAGFVVLAFIVKWNDGQNILGKVMLIIALVFAGFIFIALNSFTYTTIIKCAIEEKIERTGDYASAKVIKVTFKESGDFKDFSGLKVSTLYNVIIEYSHPETKKTKQYKFGRGFSRREADYMLSLDKINIITNGRTCFLNEDLRNLKDMPLENLKDERIHVMRLDSKDYGRVYNAVTWLAIAIELCMGLIFTISCIIKKSFVYLIGAFICFYSIKVTFTNRRKEGKKRNLLTTHGKKTFADSFKKFVKNPMPEPDIDRQTYYVGYTFTTEDGQVITAEEMLSPTDYAIIDTLEKLPIIVYKKYSMVDFDQFPMI